MDYVVWESIAVGNACMVDSIENFEQETDLLRGTPLAAQFPKDALFRMSKSHKKNTKLIDDVANTDMLKICSARIVDFLKRRRLKNVEYLPVTILDHKGKVASRDYSIVHPIVLQDALDRKKSKPSYSPLLPEEIDEVETLVIDKARVDREVRLFRLEAFFFPVLLDRAIGEAMEEEGFAGPSFEELDEYDM